MCGQGKKHTRHKSQDHIVYYRHVKAKQIKIQEKEKFWMAYVKQLAKQGSIKVPVFLLS